MPYFDTETDNAYEADDEIRSYSVRDFCVALASHIAYPDAYNGTLDLPAADNGESITIDRADGGRLAEIGPMWMTRDDGLQITLSDGRSFLLSAQEV